MCIIQDSTFLCFGLYFPTGGKFIYAMKSGRQSSKHRLVSAKVCGPKCVELYYFVEKFKKSEFRLLARKGSEGGEDRVWFSSGEESELGKWTRGVVEINAEDENCFQVMYKQYLGYRVYYPSYLFHNARSFNNWKIFSDIPQFWLVNIRSRDVLRPNAHERKYLMDYN